MRARCSYAHTLVPLALLASCGGFSEPKQSNVDGDPTRPPEPGDRPVEPYTGADSIVLEAQATLTTGLDLHRKVIQRSCGPTGGVCHNQKEYPDMRTPATFLSNASAPCNLVPKQYFTVFDRCEPTGDTFRFEDSQVGSELAHLELIPGEAEDFEETGNTPTADSPGLHMFLRDSFLSDSQSLYGRGEFLRTIDVNGAPTEYVSGSYESRFWILDDGRHLFAEVPEYRTDAANALMESGLALGDLNRNGVFGAEVEGRIPLLNPGNAEESYIVGRLRGRVAGQPVPGTRMPLANQVPSNPEMVALACFIEGLPTDGSPASMSWSIDYKNCSWTADPTVLSLTGSGAPTWSGRIWPLLTAACGGCHNDQGDAPEGLDLVGETAWSQLLGPSAQQPGLKLVEPGNPTLSYLWRKLQDDVSISGSAMPPGGSLTAQELADIEAWILDGALN